MPKGKLRTKQCANHLSCYNNFAMLATHNGGQKKSIFCPKILELRFTHTMLEVGNMLVNGTVQPYDTLRFLGQRGPVRAKNKPNQTASRSLLAPALNMLSGSIAALGGV